MPVQDLIGASQPYEEKEVKMNKRGEREPGSMLG